jgi:two-component system alkaline phosphatase synthesis response regulator PhoP
MSSSKEALLIIEDEESISEGLRFNFEHEGFEVFVANNGSLGLTMIRDLTPRISLVILDLMLPEVDGFDVLQQTRSWAFGLPILVLSARSGESDRVRSLELGADDFLAKPFSLQELILRVRGLLKRSNRVQEQLRLAHPEDVGVPFCAGVFQPSTLTFSSKQGYQVRLSPTEASLLLALAEEPNQIHSRQSLLKKVWQYESGTTTRTVDVFIGKLRKVTEANEKKPRYLLSIRGAGYAYVTDDKMREALSGSREQ